jgi:hypothetical protein
MRSVEVQRDGTPTLVRPIRSRALTPELPTKIADLRKRGPRRVDFPGWGMRFPGELPYVGVVGVGGSRRFPD